MSHITFSDLLLKTSESLKPAERLTISEAAAKYRWVNNPGSYVGPWLNETTPYLVGVMNALTRRDYNSVIFIAPAQAGKMLDVRTPILTTEGWSTMGGLCVGDKIFGPDGLPTSVIYISPTTVKNNQYKITFTDGSVINAGGEHLWTVDVFSYGEYVKTSTLSTEQLIPIYLTKNGDKVRYNIGIDNAVTIKHPEKDLPIDPYWLGYWLGNGNSYSSVITMNGSQYEELMTYLSEGYDYTSRDFRPVVNKVETYFRGKIKLLKQLNLVKNKHIPDIYKFSSENQRLRLLQGLMDSDGHVRPLRGSCEVSFSDKKLADDVYELLCSFGLKVGTDTKLTKCKDSYRMRFTPYNQYVNPFRLKCKRALVKDADYYSKRYLETLRRRIVSIEPLEHKVPMLCISVDNKSHLYLAGKSLIPTHNTDLHLNWLLYSVICDPGDMILYQTSQTMARDFSRRRIDRLHYHSKEVGKRLLSRSDADNTYDKQYLSGMLYTLSWPTINELSGRPVGRVGLTDYDRMPPDVDGEGSPFDLARKRTTTFGSSAMTYCESSPGFSVSVASYMPKTAHEAPPAPGIFSLYNRGDRHRWYWPCVHCHEYYEPHFKLLVWPNSNDIIECGEAAAIMCPHCGALTEAHQKYDVNAEGHWVAEGQTISKSGIVSGTGIRSDMGSFWLRGPAAAFASWKTLVVNYLKAEEEFLKTGSQEALKSTVNTDQAEVYFERGTGASRLPEDLKAKAEDFGDEPCVPLSVRFLIATVDVQANRWEVQVQGIVPPPNEGALPDIVVIDRFPVIKSKRLDQDGEHLWVKPSSHIEDWDLLTEQVLRKTYPLADGSGRRMAIKLTGCDSGGKKGVTGMAYQYWRNLAKDGIAGRLLLVKGTGEPSAPRINLIYPDSSSGRKDRKALSKGEIPVLLIQTDKVKDDLNNALDRETPGGMIRFSNVLDDNFYTELTVEQKSAKGKWENPRKYRNEAWDLICYCMALMNYMRVEYLDWNNPPGWAADWSINDLISQPDAERRFEQSPKIEYNTIKSIAEILG